MRPLPLAQAQVAPRVAAEVPAVGVEVAAAPVVAGEVPAVGVEVVAAPVVVEVVASACPFLRPTQVSSFLNHF